MNFGNVLNLGTSGIHVFAIAKYDSTADGTIISKAIYSAGDGKWVLARFASDGGMEFVVTAGGTYANPNFLDGTDP